MRRILLLIALLIPACAQDESTSPLEPQFSRDVVTPRALANGAVEFYGVAGQTPVAWEKYNFNAVRNGPALEARGHIAWNIRLFTGVNSFGRAEIGCASVKGNTAWLAGAVTSIVREGVTVVPGGPPMWMIIRVTDVGEGNGNVDLTTHIGFVPFNPMPMWCELQQGAPPSGQMYDFPIVRGNLTVHSH